MKKFSIRIKTASGEVLHFALARSAKEAADNTNTPEEAFGITVIEL